MCLLIEGSPETSIPPILDAAVCIDFRKRDVYFSAMFDLILMLHGISFNNPTVSALSNSLQSGTTARPSGKRPTGGDDTDVEESG